MLRIQGKIEVSDISAFMTSRGVPKDKKELSKHIDHVNTLQT